MFIVSPSKFDRMYDLIQKNHEKLIHKTDRKIHVEN